MDVLNPVRAERAVAGMLAGGHVQPSEIGRLGRLAAGDFADLACGDLYDAARSMLAAGTPVEFMALDNALTLRYGSGRAAELMQIAVSESVSAGLQKWDLSSLVEQIRQAARRRKLAAIGDTLKRMAATETVSPEESIDTCREGLQQLTSAVKGWYTAGDAMAMAAEGTLSNEQPFATGIPDLDRILAGGFRPGEFAVIGARPSVGKSAALLHLATQAAAGGGHVLMYSAEMLETAIGQRMLSRETGINNGKIRIGSVLTDSEREAMAAAVEDARVQYAGFEILSEGGLSVEDVYSETLAKHGKQPVGMVIVDYLQKLRSRKPMSSDYETVSHISSMLQQLAMRLSVPVVTAAQVGRQHTQGGPMRAPGLDELRSSGNIEQDADIVLLLHRVEAENDPVLNQPSFKEYKGWVTVSELAKRDLQLIMVHVAKNRSGAVGTAWSAFQAKAMRFMTLEDAMVGGVFG